MRSLVTVASVLAVAVLAVSGEPVPPPYDVLILASTVVIDLCCHADQKGSQ